MIKGNQTLNGVNIVNVDLDPTLAGADVPKGSLALQSGGQGPFYKYAAGSMEWDNLQHAWKSIANFTRISDTRVDIDLGSIIEENEVFRPGRPLRFKASGGNYFYGLVFSALSKIKTMYNFLNSTHVAQVGYYTVNVEFAPDFATLGVTPPSDTGYTYNIETYNSPGGPDEQTFVTAIKASDYTFIFVDYLSGDTFRIFKSNAINEPSPGQLTFTAGDPDTPVGYSIFTDGTNIETYAFDTAILVNFFGAPFTTSVDDFLQFAPMSHIVRERFFLGGQYAAVASADVMYDVYQQFTRWAYPTAYLVYGEWEVVAEDSGATKDKINFAINGTPCLTTNGGIGKDVVQSGAILAKSILSSDLDVGNVKINPLDSLEVQTDGGGDNKDASDLSILLTFVLE